MLVIAVAFAAASVEILAVTIWLSLRAEKRDARAFS